MTDAQPAPNKRRRAGKGHHGWKTEALGWGACALSEVLPSPARHWVVWLGVAAVAVGFVGTLRHLRKDCPVCVAASPVNGTVEAYELRPVLTTHHVANHWATLVGVPVSVTVCWFLTPEPWPTATTATVMVGFAVAAVARRLHDPVSPWCVRCNPNGGGGGGHDDLSDAPTPASPRTR